ncbi:hypothetical protein F4560_007894 [Saccharothrix ecbatanensis]|uniref:DUF3558 domain-containing protein n=1 Tax=Saccharothrix ecbatanensis TaxID=1105145 RepID=A0A7W9HTX2_9PSEU|nr:DUF3558 domain-containing protein [Saccharothrix ecbatanensis]MBB5808126.1 hypothetical protein [Saccharothrix ecbatanensis]
MVAVVSACTSTGGTATPATTVPGTTTGAASTSSSEADGSGVPPITGPELDLSKFGPCELLKADQLAARTVTKPGEVKDSAAGKTCQWRPQDRVLGTSFSATILEGTSGIDNYYKNREGFAEFEEIEVAGYPGFNGSGTDLKSGSCTTGVGVAKGEGFLVQVHVNDEKLPEYTKPCSVTGAIAKTVVENLKG